MTGEVALGGAAGMCRLCDAEATVLFLFTVNRLTLDPAERAYCAPHAAQMRLNFRHRILDERLIYV